MRKPLLILLASAAFALADCPEGARKTTDAEQAFYTSTMEALSGIVPPAPAGWELKKSPILKPGSSVCKGSDANRVTYTAQYTWLDGIKEQRKHSQEMERKVAALRQMPPEKEAEVAELYKQSRAMRREAIKARADKNTAEVERLEKLIQPLDQKAAEIKKAHAASVQPAISEAAEAYLQGEKSKSYEVTLSLAVNQPPAGTGAKNLLEVRTGAANPAGSKMKIQSLAAQWHGAPEQTGTLAKLLEKSALQPLVAAN